MSDTRREQTRFRRWAGGLMRVTALFLVFAIALGWFNYRSARASVMERLIGIGRRMAPYLDDGRNTETPRQVRLNGIKLFVAAGHTAHPPAAVRRFYQDRYAARGDGFASIRDELVKKGALPPDTHALNQTLFGTEDHGGVAALDFGEPLSLRALKERFTRFIGSGQLGEIARLRYVYCEKTADGGTRFLTVWNDESLRLDKIMPAAHVDVEGSDIANVPRFPGSVRILSAEEHGMPQKIAVFDGVGSPETAELFFRARLETLGWQEDDAYARVAQRQQKRSSKWNKAGQEVVIDLSPSTAYGGVTIVTIALH